MEQAVVGTVSGTNITFGLLLLHLNSARTEHISITFDSTNNKVVIAYEDYGNSQYGTAIVGTVSGTSIILDLLLYLNPVALIILQQHMILPIIK